MIADILMDVIKPEGIYERNDVPVRELEGLKQIKGFVRGNFNTTLKIRENCVDIIVDIKDGQKTGYFLDQRENRAAMADICKGADVLDCFCHTGSFSVHAAKYGAKSVTGVDISAHATECAAKNASLNSLDHICNFVTANAFDYLRELRDNKSEFDVVILDPPAFTKSRETVKGAIRGYKEINLQALKLIKPEGFLVSCSCSHHIDDDLFLDIIYDASIDAKRQVKIVELRSQAKDHPILLASPETKYLKFVIAQVI
jgi:23S rRNA (cytosine1962-C5)-methyltransferase